MSKMPTNRTTEWGRIFDRFGSLDGMQQQKPATENARPVPGADADIRNGRPVGSLSQPMPQGRRVRK